MGHFEKQIQKKQKNGGDAMSSGWPVVYLKTKVAVLWYNFRVNHEVGHWMLYLFGIVMSLILI